MTDEHNINYLEPFWGLIRKQELEGDAMNLEALSVVSAISVNTTAELEEFKKQLAAAKAPTLGEAQELQATANAARKRFAALMDADPDPLETLLLLWDVLLTTGKYRCFLANAT